MAENMPEDNGLTQGRQTEDWRSKASKEALLERALMLKNIRAFFDAREVLEVDTPVLSKYSTTDPHLDTLQSRFRDQACYLNTSPEYAMKRLLAGSNRPIYQVCKCFRDDEPGPSHNPEFTMLEWYRPAYTMTQLMQELGELIAELVSVMDSGLGKGASIKTVQVERLSYQQAFEQAAGFDPHQLAMVSDSTLLAFVTCSSALT